MGLGIAIVNLKVICGCGALGGLEANRKKQQRHDMDRA
jgi:hypothetical protein